MKKTINIKQEKDFYFNSIDGLRLCASVNIILFHFVNIGGLNDLSGKPGWLFLILKGPMFHASLFFILAGFIFTIKYIKYGDSFNGKTLLINRFKDLYPLHTITTLMMLPFFIIPFLSKFPIDIKNVFYSLFVHLSFLFSILPNNVLSFNTPSWALSAFFLCYILFAPTLKIVAKIKNVTTLFMMILLTILPSIIWAVIFIKISDETHYSFFHIFAPIRFFEFVLGMLLARLYIFNSKKNNNGLIRNIPLLNDFLILSVIILLFLNLKMGATGGITKHWISYHVIVLPLYSILLYRLARGNGIIAGIFATKIVRNLGKSSFYPYLLHIPLITWTCTILEKKYGYMKFLHKPLNIIFFMTILYAGSYLWFVNSKRRKKFTYTHKYEIGSQISKS